MKGLAGVAFYKSPEDSNYFSISIYGVFIT